MPGLIQAKDQMMEMTDAMNMQTPSQRGKGKLGLYEAALHQEAIQPFSAREGVDPLTQAFEKKIAVHAGFGGHSLPAAERASVLDGLLNRPRWKRSAVYIHVPFCESHCLYCGFYNQPYRRGDSGPYTDALLREIALWEGLPAMQSGPVHAVYIGGGTPTALDARDLRRILRTVRDAFPLANDCEITVEGRIHGFDAEKMAACLDSGANRFSLGVQTFHTELRHAMNRMVDRDGVLEAVARLRDDGRAVVVIDLIYGFPGQSMDMWRRDIECFLSLGIDGVDFYQLNLFDSSPLAKAIGRGRFPPAADLPDQAQMFKVGAEMMESARYTRLSMSHWGRTTRERNIYNHMMKGASECLAFGPGGGGCLGGHFYFVENDYDTWAAEVERGHKPVSLLVVPHPMFELDKTISAGFDLGRLEMRRLEAQIGGPAAPMLSPLLEQWQRAGLITMDGGWLELTLAGQFWHVNLAQLLIDYIHRSVSEASD